MSTDIRFHAQCPLRIAAVASEVTIPPAVASLTSRWLPPVRRARRAHAARTHHHDPADKANEPATAVRRSACETAPKTIETANLTVGDYL